MSSMLKMVKGLKNVVILRGVVYRVFSMLKMVKVSKYW